MSIVHNMELFTKPLHLICLHKGVVERKNCTLKEMINAMLISFGLPQKLWGEAILAAKYILNKVSRKKVDQTPYEQWNG